MEPPPTSPESRGATTPRASPSPRRVRASINDAWDDVQRQKLVRFILRLLGTADDGQDEARSYLALDWLLRTHTPAWLDLAGHMAEAAVPRASPHRGHALRSGRSVPATRTAQAAAWSAAWSAASAAAESAARSAARLAHRRRHRRRHGRRQGRRHGGRQRVGGMSGRQWRHGGRHGRRHRQRFTPTVEVRQASALDLLDAMIDPRRVTA